LLLYHQQPAEKCKSLSKTALMVDAYQLPPRFVRYPNLVSSNAIALKLFPAGLNELISSIVTCSVVSSINFIPSRTKPSGVGLYASRFDFLCCRASFV